MRYKCTVCYDGSQFHGFQTQSDLRTVQIEIEAALEIIHKRKVNIFACSRTDAGVHAYGQIFHFDSEIKMPEWNMQNAINSRLPNDIYIKKVEIVSEDFHARYQVSKKEYHYLIDVGGSDYYYQGRIYSIRVYNKVLTQEEILHNYNYDKQKFNMK